MDYPDLKIKNIMNKKAYIKPSIEVTELVSEVVMSTTSIGIVRGKKFDTSDDEYEQYVNARRDVWGTEW